MTGAFSWQRGGGDFSILSALWIPRDLQKQQPIARPKRTDLCKVTFHGSISTPRCCTKQQLCGRKRWKNFRIREGDALVVAIICCGDLSAPRIADFG